MLTPNSIAMKPMKFREPISSAVPDAKIILKTSRAIVTSFALATPESASARNALATLEAYKGIAPIIASTLLVNWRPSSHLSTRGDKS